MFFFLGSCVSVCDIFTNWSMYPKGISVRFGLYNWFIYALLVIWYDFFLLSNLFPYLKLESMQKQTLPRRMVLEKPTHQKQYIANQSCRVHLSQNYSAHEYQIRTQPQKWVAHIGLNICTRKLPLQSHSMLLKRLQGLFVL